MSRTLVPYEKRTDRATVIDARDGYFYIVQVKRAPRAASPQPFRTGNSKQEFTTTEDTENTGNIAGNAKQASQCFLCVLRVLCG
jgi:hypothetical protein